MKKLILSLLGLALGATVALAQAPAPLKVAWTIYPGWQPIALTAMKLQGKGNPSFLEKRTSENGSNVEVILFKEYIASINAMTAGSVDACAMTLQEALSIPTDSGVPVRVFVVNDYSNGNDQLLGPKGSKITDLAGQSVLCEEFSVSQFLVAQALKASGIDLRKVSFKHTPGDEIPKVFLSSNPAPFVCTWNPHVTRIVESGKAEVLFTSKQIPGQIVDCIVIREDRIAGNEKAIQAFVNAYFDVLAFWQTPANEELAVKAMTNKAEMDSRNPADLALFRKMLDATAIYKTPKEAAAFMKSADLAKTHDSIRQALVDFGAFKGTNPEKYQVKVDTTWVDAAANRK